MIFSRSRACWQACSQGLRGWARAVSTGLIVLAYPAFLLKNLHIRYIDTTPVGIVSAAALSLTGLSILLLLLRDCARLLLKPDCEDILDASHRNSAWMSRLTNRRLGTWGRRLPLVAVALV